MRLVPENVCARNTSVRLMWAENLKYVLPLQKQALLISERERDRERKRARESLPMSANVALWVGRRHLFSLICSSLCGCFYKNH